MNYTRIFYALCLSAIICSLVACSESNPVGEYSLGSIDPTVFVAVGDNVLAGYQSGALFEEGQRYSIPNLIAQQLRTPFVQPLMPWPGTGEAYILEQLRFPFPVIASKGITQNYPVNLDHTSAYHNLGLPGAIFYDAVDVSPIDGPSGRAIARGNPFYLMIMRDQQAFGPSLLDQAIRLQPTVLLFWMGHNDVLFYAASGGTRGTNTGVDGSPPGTLPTERVAFQQMIQGAFAKIKATLPNTKVLIGTLPHVTLMPYFSTAPRKWQNPDNPAQQLPIYYQNKQNNVAIVSEYDYVLLSAVEELANGRGLDQSDPLPSTFVLDVDEVSICLQAVTDYNTFLRSEAHRNGFTVVDLDEYLEHIHEHGYMAIGESYSTEFISGGLFSLDGIHYSSRGNAIIANRIIEEMNRAFGANIQYVQLHGIPGFPAPGRFTKTR